MELLAATPSAWGRLAAQRFDEVLVDHAHCEKKAAAQALSMVAAFPDVPGLARAMARLAREEASHLAQVLQLVAKPSLRLPLEPPRPRPRGRSAHLEGAKFSAALEEARGPLSPGPAHGGDTSASARAAPRGSVAPRNPPGRR